MDWSQLTRFRAIRRIAPLVLMGALSACHENIFDPAGDIARQQAHLVVISTVLMLLIIIPVMALTVFFAWKYRSGGDGTYDPSFHHSTQLELVIWSAPLLIIIALGSVTWVGTHLLDPYRPVDQIAPGQPVAPGTKPLVVDVVALDWKWLFIYPEQKIASVNELALPTNRPIEFRITSATVMNSFFVPALAGQIYAMPGMASQLHAVLNKTGDFRGFSANYSGAGFSQMHFQTLGLSPADFDGWVAKSKQGGTTLDANGYLALSQPSIADPVKHFAGVSDDLFTRIVNLCVEPGKMCTSQMMALDARGGTGKAGAFNLASLTYDKFGRPAVSPMTSNQLAGAAPTQKAFVKALCAPKTADAPAPAAKVADAAKAAKVAVAGAQPHSPLS